MNRSLSLSASTLIACCTASFAVAQSASASLPPSSAGTPQPITDASGRASATTVSSDTDYRFIGDGLASARWGDRFKNIPFGSSGDVRLSLSVHGYIEGELFKDQNFGQIPGEDVFWNRRLNVYGAASVGDRLRIVGALKHGDRNGFRGFVPAVERDELDPHQAFIEIRMGDALGLGIDDALFRTGRQELHYGAGRLISVRQGPNVRQDFDGALFRLRRSSAIYEAFAFFDVFDRAGDFDNRTNNEDGVWGVYGTLPIAPRRYLDLYYIGDRRSLSPYLQGTFSETRQSFGSRYWIARSPDGGWFGDIEATYQAGDASHVSGRGAEVSIDAWSVSGQAAYSWPDARWSPVASLSFGFSSGDTNLRDGELGTFRAPNPPGRYFGETTPFGPGNLAGGGLSWSVTPIAPLSLEAGVDFFWRVDTDDGIYTPAGTIVRREAGNDRFAGWELGVTARYRIDAVWAVHGEIGHFWPGAYLKDNPPARDVTRVALGIDLSF